MLVRCPLVERGAQLHIEHVSRIGEVLRHFLLDGAALGVPLLLAVVDALHARRLDVERHVEIFRGDSIKILRERLARVGVEGATHGAADIGELIGGEARTAAEHHMLLRVGGARKTGRRLFAADEVIHRRGCNGRERVPHDDDAEPVLQRRAQHFAVAP